MSTTLASARSDAMRNHFGDCAMTFFFTGFVGANNETKWPCWWRDAFADANKMIFEEWRFCGSTAGSEAKWRFCGSRAGSEVKSFDAAVSFCFILLRSRSIEHSSMLSALARDVERACARSASAKSPLRLSLCTTKVLVQWSLWGRKRCIIGVSLLARFCKATIGENDHK